MLDLARSFYWTEDLSLRNSLDRDDLKVDCLIFTAPCVPSLFTCVVWDEGAEGVSGLPSAMAVLSSSCCPASL